MRSTSAAVGALLLLGCLTAGALAADGQLTLTYDFARPALSRVVIAGETFDRITMPDTQNSGRVGQPALPARGAHILIPFGAEVTGIDVFADEQVLLGTGYRVAPIAPVYPLSKMPDEIAPPQPDPSIYGSDQPWPAACFDQVGLQAFRGYEFVVLRLKPMTYVPATGTLTYAPRLTVVIHTADTGRGNALLRGYPADAAAAARKVDNPAVLDSYPALAPADERSFDLLIITTPALSSAFLPLKNQHDAYGLTTEIHLTSDIGSTNPVDIRNYIKERYLSDGIEYVIIGGDDDVIPCKDLYVDGTNDMPGDIFFSCLDGSWNSDGDSYWGEPTDGEFGGDVDLVADVYVGRASVNDATEAGRFVNKSIWYMTNGHSKPEEALLVGEYLGFGGVAEWGGNYLDELIDGSSAHGYTTVGIPSEDFNIDTLYERDGSWSTSDLAARINSGLHFLNHLGHGSPEEAMKLSTSEIVSLLTNDDLCFVYSQTCSAGHLDGTDCWAEYANIKTDHAAFAVIMNARYGYGEWESTDGPSQRFNRELWDAVFAEDLPELGRANSDSKEDNIWRIDDDCMRWCCYELNLFGDPAIRLRGTCLDAGFVDLDSNKYNCEATADLLVNDCGLNLSDTAFDTVTINVASDSEPAGEELVLTETDPASAKFIGTLTLSSTDAPGVLLIAEGDTVTATYIDADDGEGGYNVVVTDEAVIDCTPPIIGSVWSSDVEPRSATVHFNTNEPCRGVVHYGLTCDMLTWSASVLGYSTQPTVSFAGLDDDTTYYYAVEAIDEAGNSATSDAGGLCYSFTTPEVPDFFTELFGSDQDVEYLSLIFEPNGSVDFYNGCVEEIEALPVDPDNGTVINMSSADTFQQVTLSGGAHVYLYGQSYSTFFVGSNGYITFSSGDSDWSESLADHFDQPRISAMFNDFNCTTYGQITWQQMMDRVVVSWDGIPEYYESNYNTFQIEMYFDGMIKINYETVDCDDGLVGLSEGEGLSPDYWETDVSDMGACSALKITLAEPIPELIPPLEPLIIPVMIVPGSEMIESGSEHLYYRFGPGAFTPVPLIHTGGGEYEATLPAPFCGAYPEMYFQATGHLGTVIRLPELAPFETFATYVGVYAEVFADDFELEQGWTVESIDLTDGAWQCGVPVGSGAAGDPTCDCDGSGKCFVTANRIGNSDVDGGPTRLVSPMIDLTGRTYPVLQYARWWQNDDLDNDPFDVEASDDGGATWTLLEHYVDSASAPLAWVEREVHLAEYINLTDQVVVRFSVADQPNNSISEGGVDAILIFDISCDTSLPGDLNCDGALGFADINPFVLALSNPDGYAAQYPDCDRMNGDINDDGLFDFRDINPFVLLLSGG